MTTTVVNIKHCDVRDYIYIGRQGGWQHFGNPFRIGKDGNREEVVEKCRKWLNGEDFPLFRQMQRAWILNHLIMLKDEKLGCHCVPLPCHGSILADMTDRVEI